MANMVYIKCSNCNTTFPVNATALNPGLIQGRCVKCGTAIEFNYLGIPNNEQSPVMTWTAGSASQPQKAPQQPHYQQPQQQYHQPHYTGDPNVIVKCKTLSNTACVINIIFSVLFMVIGFVLINSAKYTWSRSKYEHDMGMGYYFIIAGIALLVYYIVMMMRWSSNELTLSNTRLYGRIKPNKLIDIPLNSIVNIEFKSGPTVFWHRIILTTQTEVIKIKYFDNLKYVYDHINNNLANRRSY